MAAVTRTQEIWQALAFFLDEEAMRIGKWRDTCSTDWRMVAFFDFLKQKTRSKKHQLTTLIWDIISIL